MKPFHYLVLPLVFLFGLLPPAQAEEPSLQEKFVRGNIAYGNGEFVEAERIYREVLGQARSAEVHYNLGNALAQQDKWSEAAFHYLKAHSLEPGLEPAGANLLLTAQRLDLANQYPRLPGPANLLSSAGWSLIAATAFWIALILCFHGRFVRFRLPFSKTGGLLCSFILIASLVALYQHELFRQWAIVSVAETTLRVAPTLQSPGESTVFEGNPVRVLREEGDFFHVKAPDGDEGFILRKEVHPRKG